MRVLFIILSIYVFTLDFAISESNKYSAKHNDIDYRSDNYKKPSKESENPFRMAKVNAVWQKAKKKLSQEKLARLFEELIKQDEMEIESKHLTGRGKDSTGIRADKVRQKLEDIMLRYGMMRPSSNELPTDTSRYLSKEENEVLDKEPKQKIEKDAITFNKYIMQKKIDTLWTKTQYAGFTEEELKELRIEFSHHKDKLNQFYELATVPLGGYKHNSVKDFDNPTKIKNYKAQEYSDLLLYEFDRLQGKTHEKLQEKNGGFTEIKTMKLWQLAKEANFTDVELASFKEEMKHFENKILKVEHYQDQLIHAKQWKKSYGTENDDKINVIKDKVVSMDSKAQKIHKELKRKIEMAFIKSEL